MPSTSRSSQVTLSLVYHVINRGHARSVLYHDKEDFERFVRILAAYAKNFEMKVYHWVLMPNHFHLLAELLQPKDISRIMAGVSRSYVHYYHRKYDSVGHLFQGRFKSQPIAKEDYMLACARYIERNPVKSALSVSAEAYPYSSAAFYCLGQSDLLTETDPCYDSFGQDIKQRREGYQKYLQEFNIDEELSFGNFEAPMGSEEFKRRLIKERGIFIPRNGRPRSRKVVR
jgi:putative transposase